MPQFKIKDRIIGPGHPCYVIAEMSANHAGSFERALAIVKAAKESGADAIKLQTYTADTMTLNVENDYFRIKDGLWKGQHLYKLYEQASTPWEWHKPLQQEAQKIGLHFFSTPFDETAVDFLDTLEVPAYKIASFELIDDPLLTRVAKTKKPVIVSTGMATLSEIEHALVVLRSNGSGEIALLKCVSAYPAPADEMNLLTMADMKTRFQCSIGLSDHSLGNTVPIAAVALGAQILEKHLMVGDGQDTLDAAFSMTPQAFKGMVDAIRLAENALGKVQYLQTPQQSKNLLFRRSIFVIKDIKKGDIFTEQNIRVIRPGDGFSPEFYQRVVGTKAQEDIPKGNPLLKKMLDKNL